jgi:DNA-binding NarL/FixJ family response regulator
MLAEAIGGAGEQAHEQAMPSSRFTNTRSSLTGNNVGVSPEDPECRVVVCDDQPSYRKIVSAVLGLEPGLVVVGEAANGQEAVNLVKELRPDVLVLDIAMPVLDGLEALPLIHAASPETKVVMLTGVASDTFRSRAREGGAALFIEKGTNIQDVVEAVAGVCGGPS